MAQKTKESLLPPLWVLTIVFLTGFFWLLFALKEIVVLLVVGYTLAYVIDPILDKLEKRKISREVGFFIVAIVFGFFGLLFFGIALPPLVEELKATLANASNLGAIIADRTDNIVTWINGFLPAENQLVFSREMILEHARKIDTNTIKSIFVAIGGFLLEGYSIGLTLVNLFLLPLIVFYLAVDLDRFHRWFLGLIPRSIKKPFKEMTSQINVLLRAFVVGQSIVCIVLALLYAIGFAIAGHHQWFLLAAVAGLGNIVPYVGTISGAVLSIVFSLTSDAPIWMLTKTAVVFTVVQLLEGTIITPRIVGNKVGLSPLVVILAILIGGKLFGLLGVFLAVPAAATLRVAGGYAHRAIIRRTGDN